MGVPPMLWIPANVPPGSPAKVLPLTFNFIA
jgi:hypothetical protein